MKGLILKTKVLVAIPMFNCEAQVQRVLIELFAEKKLWTDLDTYLLVIDNRSTDNSLAVVKDILRSEQFSSQCTLIQNEYNIGLGGSQKQAFSWAMRNDFDLLVVLHGDHQATPKEMGRLIFRSGLTSKHSAVLGSRFSPGSVRQGYSRVRTWGNKGLNLLYTLLCLKRIDDLGSGLNLFRVSDFEISRVMNYSSGFTFNMDLLLDMVTKKKSFIFCPITWTELDQVSNARNFKVGWVALSTLIKWRFGLSRNADRTSYGYKVVWRGQQ